MDVLNPGVAHKGNLGERRWWRASKQKRKRRWKQRENNGK
jgi:hypothetical protein